MLGDCYSSRLYHRKDHIMAKKAELLEKAVSLGLELSEKNTIAEIEAAIANVDTSTQAAEPETATAKAGKRSAKALAEAEVKAEKEERKSQGDTTPQSAEAEAKVKKGPKPIARPKSERRGKKYQEAAKEVNHDNFYNLADALALAAKTSPSKFDASVEVHVRLGVDPRQADQNIRATVSLPHGTGKTIRVAVFAPEADHAAASKAGADVVGDEEFLKQLDKEVLDFDVLVATPAYMPRLSKYARLLGPRGIMPNPKSGTVATDVAKAVSEAKTGKVEYRVDKQSIVHLAIGKVSFGADKLHDNAKVFFESLVSQKPASIKSAYVKTISVSSTQGPGIKVENTIN
jgi:large subunit ribosomal protein L1